MTMTPEQYQALLDAGSENENLARQMEMAQQLRSPMKMRGAPGGYQVAPHWTEMVGNMANTYMQQKTGEKMTANSAAQNKSIMDAILKSQPTQQTPGQVGTGINPFALPPGGVRFGQ